MAPLKALHKRIISIILSYPPLWTEERKYEMAKKQKGKRHDPNPRKDPDVQRGYDRHQENHKKKEIQRERKQKGEIEKPYEVDPSGGTIRGPSKREH